MRGDSAIVVSRTDSWDVVGACMLAQVAEMEVARVQRFLPQGTNAVTRLVVKNIGRTEATNVRLTFRFDSIADTISVTATADFSHALQPDSSKPGFVRGLAEDIEGARVFRADRWTAGMAAVTSVEQRFEHQWQDTVPSLNAPTPETYIDQLVASEIGRTAPSVETKAMLDVLGAAATITLVDGNTTRRGYVGDAIVDRTWTMYKLGSRIGPSACKTPAGFKYDRP